MITVSVNGQSQRWEPGMSVGALIQALALGGRKVAVERNGEIVPRSRFGEIALCDGDAIEIVVAVGGG